MSNWRELAREKAGQPTSPGRDYHHVIAIIERRDERIKITLREARGANQGSHLEPHHKAKVVAIADDLDTAARIVNSRAQAAEMHEGYMVQALSQAHAEAVDVMDDATAEGQERQMVTSYTLTDAEAARYDSDDDRVSSALTDELLERFGPLTTHPGVEVHHPDGYVISVHEGGSTTLLDVTPITWLRRDEDGNREILDASDVMGYCYSDYPGPGEEHADIDGIWYEVGR